MTHATTYMDVRSALASNDLEILGDVLSDASINERHQSILEAIQHFVLTLRDTSFLSNDIFDTVAEFIINHNLTGQLYRSRRGMRGCRIDKRFIDFYRFCIFLNRRHGLPPELNVRDEQSTPISIAMRLRTGGTATGEEISRALAGTRPDFVRDWIYRACAEENCYLPEIIEHIQSLADLESLLHELSIAGPLLGEVYEVSEALATKVVSMLSNASFSARQIEDTGFGEIIDAPITLPDLVIGSKILRSDIEAFNSRFIFRTKNGYLGFGTLGIGLGQYAICCERDKQLLLSHSGVAPSTAHIPAFLRFDLNALEQLSRSDALLINPNFSRLGDCLDRFSFVHELLVHTKNSPAGLMKNLDILESVQENFISPVQYSLVSDQIGTYTIGALRARKFDRHYINSCHFRNNTDRRLSFTKKMVKSLAGNGGSDIPSLTLQTLRTAGFFIVHFAIEAEKRAFKNQWDVLAQIIIYLRMRGIDKLVMLNSGLTSVAGTANDNISGFETNWPEKIINALPSEYRANAFVPMDLHMQKVDLKARAISKADFFIGGLVTATLIPTAAGIPSLVIGSKTALSDKYRWPSGRQTYFVPASSSSDSLSEKGKNVAAHLQSQYMSYEIDRETLYDRLKEVLDIAVCRWEKFQ